MQILKTVLGLLNQLFCCLIGAQPQGQELEIGLFFWSLAFSHASISLTLTLSLWQLDITPQITSPCEVISVAVLTHSHLSLSSLPPGNSGHVVPCVMLLLCKGDLQT